MHLMLLVRDHRVIESQKTLSCVDITRLKVDVSRSTRIVTVMGVEQELKLLSVEISSSALHMRIHVDIVDIDDTRKISIDVKEVKQLSVVVPYKPALHARRTWCSTVLYSILFL